MRRENDGGESNEQEEGDAISSNVMKVWLQISIILPFQVKNISCDAINEWLIFSLYQILANKSDGETESEYQNKTLATKIDNVEVLSGDRRKVEEGIELHSIQIHLDQKRVRYIIFTKRLRLNHITVWSILWLMKYRISN